MMDIICDEKTNECYGLIVKNADGDIDVIKAKYTVFACGGLGGLYKHSTNFRHITGDALAIALKHGIEMEHIDYIQIHPTTLYSEKPGRKFLYQSRSEERVQYFLTKIKSVSAMS